MSVSILRHGKLWGLFACHHYAPRRLPRRIWAVCELFASVFSVQLNQRLRADQAHARLASQAALQALVRLGDDESWEARLLENGSALLEYIPATGLAVHLPGKPIGLFGITPAEPVVRALCDWLDQAMEHDDILVSERLALLWPPAAQEIPTAAGILAISISREPRDLIIWFRPEMRETVKWGRDPRQQMELGRNGEPIPPQKSFEVWQQQVFGQCQAWRERDLDAAHDLRIALLDVQLRQLNIKLREEAILRAHQQRLVTELDHWITNTVGVVKALVGHTSENAPPVTEYLQGLERRIHAMVRSHGLLSQTQGAGLSLQALLEEELEAHREAGRAILLAGRDLILEPKVGLSLSLALHELASNAAAHGALSAEGGKVEVAWDLDQFGDVRLRWIERGGPGVRRPKKRGIGAKLIEQLLATQAGCEATLRFKSDGVQCDVILPGSSVVAMPGRPDESWGISSA
jgi:light-regulated signal transduction histidine kinase (bacteriophytochrome)